MNTTTTDVLTSFLRDALNTQQREAVEQADGSFLVIAGAGSGKTRVITTRIAYLIGYKQVLPHEVVALTFTNKAAKEMLERVKHFLPAGTPLPFIGTFHSYCLRFLKKHQHLMSRPFVSLLDDDDQQKMFAGIIQRSELGKTTTAKQVASVISQLKNRVTSVGQIEQELVHEPIILGVYRAYEAEKRASRCLDFDDLLLETVALLKKNDPGLQAWRSQVKHLLVDEYQDTNSIQYALLKELTRPCYGATVNSICVVGDEDQSIYSWRGATVANIAHFTNDFPDTKVIKIEQNYRSVAPILTVANKVIAHNTQRHPKKLWSDRTGKDRIRVISCLSDRQEGDMVAQCMKNVRMIGRVESCAVLYRAHFQSRALEEALIKNSIPYRIIGGVQFYERKEIKDLLAYLRLVVNPHDRVAFFRVINCPTRGLGEQFEHLFRTCWQDEPFLSYQEVAKHLIEQQAITGVRRTALEQFVAIVGQCHSAEKPFVVVESLLVKIGYVSYLHATGDKDEAAERYENIKELLRALQQFEAQDIVTVQAFLDEVALMQEHALQDSQHSNPVLLMTMHAAKGLEFDLVAITGLEEGILPSSRSLSCQDSMQEERRLCYVGITRAKNYLLLSYCRYRYTYGQTHEQVRSRFIEEMPAELTPVQDCSYVLPHQTIQMFQGWFLGTSLQQVKPQGQEIAEKPWPSTAKRQAGVSTRVAQEEKPIVATKRIQPVTSSGFKKYQTVRHCKFGLGIIQSIEDRENDAAVAQVKFSDCTKKIAVSFLTIV